MADDLPTSVCYVKNGRGGKWCPAAKANGQVHAGWSNIKPRKLLQNPGDFGEIERQLGKYYVKKGSGKGAAKRDLEALRLLLEFPRKNVWITFEEGCMWWCTVRDGAVINPRKEDKNSGNFWLVCDRSWSNLSLRKRRLLATMDLPGIVTSVKGFRATVCKPKAQAEILRVIKGRQHRDARKAARARATYQKAMENVINRLNPQDFEKRIDLILDRTGWVRTSPDLGGKLEAIDLEAKNLATDEIAFVQVKSIAYQKNLVDYVQKFEERQPRYQRMIFAVHTPKGKLTPPDNLPVQVWTGSRLAELVAQLGLGEWVEKQLA